MKEKNRYKLPRKLKKAKKHFYLTKEWYELDSAHKFIISRSFGIAGIYWEMMLQKMKRPYPYTKWIRKYKTRILQMRNQTFVSNNTIRVEEIKCWESATN